ncbi:MAG: tail fiber domain-containing protein [Verrucomicrobia bacterium]|nr:tail fiber domain-containing protein [Verrucomicrobiota bacterium]
MTFQLLESGTTTPVGTPVSQLVDVTDGLFQVDLAFDPLLFDGTPYDLQISVRSGAGPIYVLSPSTPLTATPQSLFANSVGSVPDGALAGNVARLDQPAIFLTTVSMPVLRVSDPTGSGRLLFGPTDDCSLGIDPSGPGGLLLRDPAGIRILSPSPASPPVLRFGPTDDCSLGIDPAFPGLVERDPVGFRLLGQNNEGCRLIFGPTMDCTVEVSPGGPPGLLLRDPSGIRILPLSPTAAPLLTFGPTDDCSLGIDPTRQGLRVAENYGLRLYGNSGLGDRLIFGPTDDCTIGIDPTRQGLRVAENYGLRLYGNSGTGDRLIFGPTDDCTIGIDPNGVDTGLVVYENIGFRIASSNPSGVSRLMFGPGPTDICSIIVDPDPTGIQGMQLLDQHGVRIRNPLPGGVARLSFGNNPDNLCAIEVDPSSTGLRGMKILEEFGVTILNPTAGGASRLGFGDDPDNLCTIAVDPAGPGGLQLRDPSGIRILPPAAAAGSPPSVPRILFGPTDLCRISVADDGTGAGPRMTLEDANGFLLTNDVEVQGGVTAQAFIQQSTRRLKDNIKPLENALELIQQLQGVRYDWKPENGGQADIGFIAEEVGKIFPEVVEWEKDGINARGVNYGHLVAVAMEGIKAQQAEIESLRDEKADMESRLARLEALVLENTQAQK